MDELHAHDMNQQSNDGLSYNEIMNKIKELSAQAEEIRRQERSAALQKVLSIMREYELTVAEVEAGKIGHVRRGKSSGRVKTPPKYMDPATGATWTGRGKRPAWVNQALSNGVSLESLRIEGS